MVPVDNARYALNAANARWGSLYNALYGTDVIPGEINKSWDKERAKKVIEFVKDFMDRNIPLKKTSWRDVQKIQLEKSSLILTNGSNNDFLKNDNQFIAFNGDEKNPSSILLKNNNLHFEIVINPDTMVGKIDKASISDVIVESALSTIVDNETLSLQLMQKIK